LIDDADAISFDECCKILTRKWNAGIPEVAFWIGLVFGGRSRLHVFSSHHEIYFEAFGRRFWRRRPGIEGGNLPCVALGSGGEPKDCSIEECLSYYRYSRTEVECFSPADPEFKAGAEIAYRVDGEPLDGGWFNPSGRFLSYQQVVDFLSRYASGRTQATDVVAREFRRGALNAFRPFIDWLKYPDGARAEDGLFFEGQIIGLANWEFGAGITRPDEASRLRIEAKSAPQAALEYRAGITRPDEASGRQIEDPSPTRTAMAENGFDPLSVFREMENLTPDEIRLRFAPNAIIEVSARKVLRRVPYAAFDLIDRRTGGELNKLGGILLAICENRVVPKTGKGNGKAISRLRTVFAKQLGLQGDPFSREWRPNFQIEDARQAADERAKREAERRTVSFDEERHSSEYPFGGSDDDPSTQGDPADLWLRDRGS
jgi:hypothetical protein